MKAFPVFKYDEDRHRGILVDNFPAFQTPIKGYYAHEGHAMLLKSGELHCVEGFSWDFGSGPAIDTPAMVVASMAHDALCTFTDMGLIPWKCRKQADKYFLELLKTYGMGRMRRWWCYLGVRAYSMLQGVSH